MHEADIELLTIEYIEEVVNAGGARLMSADDLATFISELVLGCCVEKDRPGLRPIVLSNAQMLLLPEECRKRGLEIDAETANKLREALR